MVNISTPWLWQESDGGNHSWQGYLSDRVCRSLKQLTPRLSELMRLTDREKLEGSLTKFFRRIPVDKPVVRNNYLIQTNVGDGLNPLDPQELAWAESMLGPEDTFRHGSHGGEEESGTVTMEGIFLRTERQTLRRLKISGGVAFTSRTYMTAVVALAEEEGVAGKLASALRSWPEDVGKYKGKDRLGGVLEYLDQIAANKQ